MGTQVYLNSANFAVSFFSNLPIERFNSSLKINHNWYKECKRELEIRRETFAKKYQDSKEEYEKATDDRLKCYEMLLKNWIDPSYDSSYRKESEKCAELYDIKDKNYRLLVNVDKACIRCGFFELIDNKQLKHYKEQYKYGTKLFRKFVLPDDEAIVNETITALKEVCKAAFEQGFNVKSRLITKSIEHIKNIQSADNPERYILSIADKLFPNKHDHKQIKRKFYYIGRTYEQDLYYRMYELYSCYRKIQKLYNN